MLAATRRAGSSPLARGLHVPFDNTYRDIGIIPARAGFTGDVCDEASGPQDHPRSRGVYARAYTNCLDGWGSSPLARGLRSRTHVRHTSRGIIPARAGFTVWSWGSMAVSEDHPRSRGVYFLPLRSEIMFSGSSPLARGLHNPGGNLSVRSRIIPARAGFTPCFSG